MSKTAPIRVKSTCPHDCPSACALEVEKLDERTIGRVYGAKDNSYTSGTLCAKVGNYAERVHHSGRLSKPLRRTGSRGVGLEAFVEIGWEEALDEVSDRFKELSEKSGVSRQTLVNWYQNKNRLFNIVIVGSQQFDSLSQSHVDQPAQRIES